MQSTSPGKGPFLLVSRSYTSLEYRTGGATGRSILFAPPSRLAMATAGDPKPSSNPKPKGEVPVMTTVSPSECSVSLSIDDRPLPPMRTRTIRQQYFIRASPREVFNSIIDSKMLEGWFAQCASLCPRKGGTYAFRWSGGCAQSGKVIGFDRGKSLTLAWPRAAGKGQCVETRLRLSVGPEGTGTLLKLRESGFPTTGGWVDHYAGSHSGWTYYMMNLKSVLEYGHDLRSGRDRTEEVRDPGGGGAKKPSVMFDVKVAARGEPH